MALTLRDRALLVKLYYQRNENSNAALREFRLLKKLRKGPMSITNLRKMIQRFEITGTLARQPGQGRKVTSQQQVEEVATAIVEQEMENVQGTSSARAVSRNTHIPYSTVRKILHQMLLFYPYKISSVQELLPGDAAKRLDFSLIFLARMQVDATWPWQILWSDEAHFHLNGGINTRNCRIWAANNPHAYMQEPLHSPKVTVWCGFTASFIIGPYFYEENGASGPVTCTVTAARYADMLQNFTIPQLQQRGCLDSTIFMQDGAPPHIGLRVQRVLRQHFSNSRMISRAFPTAWPPRSPDLTPCDFWLWGFLKGVVYQGHVSDIATLKDRITLHVRQINSDMLRAAVENVVHRMQFLEFTNGAHIEPYL